MRAEKVFLIEDDEDIALAVAEALEREGFAVERFYRALDFFSRVEEKTPDLVIIDVMLPDFDGFRVARFLRNRPDLAEVAVIFLTARVSEEDRLKGFELGADDYITKPFSLRELVARVNAVMRRINGRRGRLLSIEDLEIDLEKIKVSVDGREIRLTPSEFRILKCLVENYGRPVSRDRILEELGGPERDPTDRTVDVHIKHLRDKLGTYGTFPTLGSLSMAMLPPQNSTILLLMASPSPRPFPSPFRKKGLHIKGRSSAGIPLPVSSTLTIKTPPLLEASILILPSSLLYLTAFSITFLSSMYILSRSHLTDTLPAAETLILILFSSTSLFRSSITSAMISPISTSLNTLPLSASSTVSILTEFISLSNSSTLFRAFLRSSGEGFSLRTTASRRFLTAVSGVLSSWLTKATNSFCKRSTFFL